MKYLLHSAIMLACFFTFLSCKKAGAGTASKTAPTNLNVVAAVSTDGSGSVNFTASADNAISYEYEFGNGDHKTVATGTTSYQYTLAGTNTYDVVVTARSSSGLSVKKTIQVIVVINATTPGLIWADEFNVDGAPDPSKWGYDLGNNNGWGNAELEYYTSRRENSVVEGGVLKINAIKENFSGFTYTSARLLSKDKFAFKYGKIEIKAKIPAGVGTWPAIWMLGADIGTAGWPACGEIDIMEHRGSELNKIFGTLHYPGRSGGNADGNTKTIANATTEFHIYSLDWSATAIKIYVDDQLIHNVANTNNIPFNHDFFVILNLAIGGSFAGSVDAGLNNATMEVDYVRVYK
ncbi:MAG: bglA 1 [Daejeonella sp.]|nr:bglA 1 [Daejeonella sp.]